MLNIKKWYNFIANGLLIYAFVIAFYSLYQRISIWQLGGACPLPTQRPWLYSAIIAAFVSFLITHVANKK